VKAIGLADFGAAGNYFERQVRAILPSPLGPLCSFSYSVINV